MLLKQEWWLKECNQIYKNRGEQIALLTCLDVEKVFETVQYSLSLSVI